MKKTTHDGYFIGDRDSIVINTNTRERNVYLSRIQDKLAIDSQKRELETVKNELEEIKRMLLSR